MQNTHWYFVFVGIVYVLVAKSDVLVASACQVHHKTRINNSLCYGQYIVFVVSHKKFISQSWRSISHEYSVHSLIRMITGRKTIDINEDTVNEIKDVIHDWVCKINSEIYWICFAKKRNY